MDSIQDAVTKLVETVGELARVEQGLCEVVEEQQKDITDIKQRLVPLPTGTSELFAVVNGRECYVVRDEFGRIVVSDELMRELIERAYGSSTKEGK